MVQQLLVVKIQRTMNGHCQMMLSIGYRNLDGLGDGPQPAQPTVPPDIAPLLDEYGQDEPPSRCQDAPDEAEPEPIGYYESVYPFWF